VDEHLDPEDEIAFENAAPDEDDSGDAGSDYGSDEDYDDDKERLSSPGVKEVAKAERERLRELKRQQTAELERVRDEQNKQIAGDNKKGKWKFLLQQTEVFAHFLSGTKAANEAANKGKRGRNKSHAAEEDEDAELVEHAEDYQAVRLTTQPTCIKFGKMREY